MSGRAKALAVGMSGVTALVVGRLPGGFPDAVAAGARDSAGSCAFRPIRGCGSANSRPSAPFSNPTIRTRTRPGPRRRARPSSVSPPSCSKAGTNWSKRHAGGPEHRFLLSELRADLPAVLRQRPGQPEGADRMLAGRCRFPREQTRTALSGLCGLAAIAATRGESEIGTARGRIAAGYRPR